MNTHSTQQLGVPSVLIDTPSALVAATPPALGYVPRDEVVLWLAPLPPQPATLLASPLSDMVDDWPGELVANALSAGAASAHLLAWTDAADGTALSDLPTTRAVGEILWHADRLGLPVEVAVTTNGSTCWSHICDGVPGNCLDVGTPIDQSACLAVEAEFVGSGLQVLPSRQAVAVLIEPCDELISQVASAWPEASESRDLQTWRDAEIAWLADWWGRHLEAGTTENDPALLARALDDLSDVRVRDTVMLIRGMWGPDPTPSPHLMQPLLAKLVRAAPERAVAPPATLLGITAWLSGQVALAHMAINRALSCGQEYTLASLARTMICSDLDPAVWTDGLRDLTEYECRTGKQEHWNRRRRARRLREARRLAG